MDMLPFQLDLASLLYGILGHIRAYKGTLGYFRAHFSGVLQSVAQYEVWNIIDVILKSGIRQTKHLSTDADSSTDAIEGWSKAKSEKKRKKIAAILDHFQTKMFKC